MDAASYIIKRVMIINIKETVRLSRGYMMARMNILLNSEMVIPIISLKEKMDIK